jgi:anti-sigma regulatory factor (Ser/Thr protein kinase)
MTTVDEGPENATAWQAAWLDARPAGAAEARDLAATYLAAHGDRVPGPVLDDVLLVVSELVTNALRHAGGVTGLRVTLRNDGVEVTVQDGSREQPVTRGHGGNWLPGGYGWPMVSRLAEVAVVPLGADGKLVRATVPLDGA